jgi:hypothetical protein
MAWLFVLWLFWAVGLVGESFAFWCVLLIIILHS